MQRSVRLSEQLLDLARWQRITRQAEPAIIIGDVDRLGTLLRNLLDNAVRYAGEGGSIAACAARSHGVRIEVGDGLEGRGLSVTVFFARGAAAAGDVG